MLETKVIFHKKEKFHVKSYLILLMCLVYMVQFLTGLYVFVLLLAGLCFAAFLFSIGGAKALPRYFGIGMFITGVIMNFLKGTGMEGTVNGMLANLPLLSLVILVPLMSIPLKIGGYFDSIHFYIEKLAQHLNKLFGSISVFIFCLGPILNLGAIRVLHETIKDIKLAPVLLAKSYLVGFSTVILWSPYFASVALVLYYLDVPVLEYIPLGLTLAFIQLMIGNLLFGIWLKRQKDNHEIQLDHVDRNKPTQQQEHDHRKNLMHLMFLMTVLMGIIFLFEYVTKWPMMFVVSLVSITYPLFWAATTKKWPEFVRHFKSFKDRSVPLMNNEIVLFISAGLFGKALTGTTLAAGIKQFLNQIASTSFFLFIVFVVVIILLFTFIGIHQIVVVTALVTQMDAVLIGTQPEVLALLLMMAWSMSAVLSPVNPLNLLVSGSVKKSAFSVGLRWNGVYLLTMFIVGSAFIYLIH